MARSFELGLGSAESVSPGVRAHGGRGLAWALERYAVLFLIALAALGFGLRAGGISQVGLSEDEVNKVEAVRAYARGDITRNAEHPMMMKMLIYISMEAARAWNARGASGDTLKTPNASFLFSDEAAVRLPNVLFGALTVFPIFMLTAAFFNRRTALLAASLWAFGINAITYNRIAKEDTLLVFFMLFAFYFYIRAKQTSGFDTNGKRHNYILSGASFGLMLASKYFPHYLGLNMLYHHFVRVRERGAGEPRGSTPPLFYALMLAAFLLANPSLLFPKTWAYLNVYSGEQLLTHHGYLIGERLYDNVISKTPFGGTPVYFYPLALLIKTPLPLLVALIIGLVEIVRRRKEPGAAFLLLMFVLWIVPYSLVGAKWLRYTLSLMPFVYMICAVGITSLMSWLMSLVGWRRARQKSYVLPLINAAVAFVFIVAPAWSAFRNMPHYALYTNPLAASRAGYFFPHDEFYDDGLREAIKYICEHAPPGATIAHETPGVMRYYLEKFGRPDLRPHIISDPQFDVRVAVSASSAPPVFVILQRGRTYFENQAEMEAVRAGSRQLWQEKSGAPPSGQRLTLKHEVFINGVSAGEVYSSIAPTRSELGSDEDKTRAYPNF